MSHSEIRKAILSSAGFLASCLLSGCAGPSPFQRAQGQRFTVEVAPLHNSFYRDPDLTPENRRRGLTNLADKLLDPSFDRAFAKANKPLFQDLETRTIFALNKTLLSSFQEKLSHRVDKSARSRLTVLVDRCQYERVGVGPNFKVRLFAPTITLSTRLVGADGAILWEKKGIKVKGPKGHPLIEYRDQPGLISYESARTAAVAGLTVATELERWVSE